MSVFIKTACASSRVRQPWHPVLTPLFHCHRQQQLPAGAFGHAWIKSTRSSNRASAAATSSSSSISEPDWREPSFMQMPPAPCRPARVERFPHKRYASSAATPPAARRLAACICRKTCNYAELARLPALTHAADLVYEVVFASAECVVDPGSSCPCAEWAASAANMVTQHRRLLASRNFAHSACRCRYRGFKAGCQLARCAWRATACAPA